MCDCVAVYTEGFHCSYYILGVIYFLIWTNSGKFTMYLVYTIDTPDGLLSILSRLISGVIRGGHQT